MAAITTFSKRGLKKDESPAEAAAPSSSQGNAGSPRISSTPREAEHGQRTGPADCSSPGEGPSACKPRGGPGAARPGGRSEGFERVARALEQAGHPHAPRWLDTAARTSHDAAQALGIAVGQIAKSVIFRRRSDDVAVLVVTSGDRRVDEARVAALVGPLERADAGFVKAATGFSIGGVAPVAHLQRTITLIDRELFRFAEIWAAAGHPNGVFKLSPQQLAALTGAPIHDVVQAP